MAPLLRPGDKVLVDQSAEARTQSADGDVVPIQHADHVVFKRILAMPG